MEGVFLIAMVLLEIVEEKPASSPARATKGEPLA
jgi:hypothetical protein